MYLNLGAPEPQPQIQVVRGTTTPRTPIRDVALRAAAHRLNQVAFDAAYGETLDKVVGEKPKARPVCDPKTLELKTWPWVKERLLRLFPYFTFKEDGEGRLVMMMPAPSAMAATEWDLFPSQIKEEVRHLQEIPGPKRKLIGISTGWIPYKTDVLTEATPRRITARSLVSIVLAGKAEGIYTLDEAERVFQLKFRGVRVLKTYSDIDPLAWSRQREEATLLTKGAA